MMHWFKLFATAVAFWVAIALTVNCNPIDTDCDHAVGVAAARSAEFH